MGEGHLDTPPSALVLEYDMSPVLVLVIAVAVVFLLIIRFKVNAFIALITAAMTVGLLSPKVPLHEVMPKVAGVFGNLCARIGIVIALAALIGYCLMESGAADKITRVFVRLLGEKRASISLVASGYVLSIPVFFDTVFYLLIPLARAMRVRMGNNYVLFAMSIGAGAVATHSMVPPTPGPLAMAATLKIDLGTMIVAGSCIAVPMAIVGWIFARWCDRNYQIPFRETAGMSIADLEQLANEKEERLPGFLHSISPILLPVLMITTNTLSGALGLTGAPARAAAFLGDPNFALLVSATIAMQLLAKRKGYSLAQLAGPVEVALTSGGLIILITAAGGAFGGMLVEAGVGKALSDLSREYHFPLLLLSFLLGVMLKVAQGSGTVAMITVSSIMAPLVVEGPIGFHPVYVACAIGSGSIAGSWMNDSGFWVFKQMGGFTEVEALKTWTPLLVVLGVTGYLATQLAAVVLPLR